MTNSEMLNGIIKDSGLKKGYIAEQLGITMYSLSMKIENKREFKASEIAKLCTLLRIDSLEQRQTIFFCA